MKIMVLRIKILVFFIWIMSRTSIGVRIKVWKVCRIFSLALNSDSE